MTSLWDWNKSATSNTSAPPAGFPTGQPPSNVRVMIQYFMAYLTELAHSLTTTGSANAYVGTLTNIPASLTTGMVLLVNPNFTNTGASTLNLNSLGAKNIKIYYANGLVALSGFEMQSGGQYWLSYDGTQFILLNPSLSALSASRGFINGFETGAPGGAQTLTIGPGSCVDGTNAFQLLVTTTFTKTMGAWAVGTGNGGLDTGAVGASTAYFVWVIQRSDTQVIDYLISLSGTAPTLPANYTIKRGPIAWFKTDGGSNILQYQQRGDEFIYGVSVLDVNATALAGGAGTLVALTVPSGFQVNALFRADLAATAAAGLLLTSPDETDQALGAGLHDLFEQTNGSTSSANFNRRTNTSAQIRWRANGANGTFSIGTYGFVWTRGRNS